MNRIALPLIVSAIVFATSCTKEVTRVEEKYIENDQPALEYITDGNIKGTVTGYSYDFIELNDPFEFNQLLNYSEHSWCRIYEDGIDFNITRNDYMLGSYINLKFFVPNLLTQPILWDYPVVRIVVPFTNNEQLVYAPVVDYINENYEVTNVIISGITYDPGTSIVTGNYTISVDMEGALSTITGSFDTYVLKTFFKSGSPANRFKASK